MILTKLDGGLGNQLFQYACGKAVALKTGTELKLDTTRYTTGVDIRSYGLNHFNINAAIATEDDIASFDTAKLLWEKHVPFFLRRFLPSVYVKERGRFYDARVFHAGDSTYLHGYWQSWRYFDDIRNVLEKELTLREEPTPQYQKLIEKIAAAPASVAVQVRRGDYVKDPAKGHRHIALPEDYYQRARKRMESVTSHPTYFVFSDEIDWCKENLNFPHDTVYDSEHLPDYESIVAISKCDHHIIANSSFGWWGAWLNPNNQKTVIAPKAWYNNASYSREDKTPPSWITI